MNNQLFTLACRIITDPEFPLAKEDAVHITTAYLDALVAAEKAANRTESAIEAGFDNAQRIIQLEMEKSVLESRITALVEATQLAESVMCSVHNEFKNLDLTYWRAERANFAREMLRRATDNCQRVLREQRRSHNIGDTNTNI